MLALNASNVSGTTTDLTAVIRSLGWNTAEPANAASFVERSVVLFRPGDEVVAANLANDLGIRSKRELGPDVTPFVPQDVDVAILVGPDLALAGP